MLPRMAACASCGSANPDGARFCNGCGSPLVAPGPVREERKVVTVLFADLAGFTSRSETLDPEDVRAFLLPYYGVLTSEITRHGGHVDRFLGDGVMALFGAPTAHEDDPERAVRAALRILERIPALGLDLHVRLGINTGPVLFAAGSGGERDDAVTGDAVNTAARLQALAPVDGVVVGEPTYRATAHLFAFDELPDAKVKGKAAPVRSFRPTAPLVRSTSQLRAETTPFVGRDVELALLTGLFERSRTTPSLELATVIAEPGMGKSRLVRELARHVDTMPELVTWRVGRCLPYGDGISLWALGEIVKSHAGILDTDDQATLATKLDAVLTEPDPSMRAWMEDRLAPLVGLQTATEPPSQEEAFTAWRRFLEQIAQAGPTVLVVDDLHWADDTLVGFLSHLADHIAGLPLVLVTTARPEIEERHPAWLARTRRSTVISLAALPEPAMTALVAGSLPDASPALLATIVERAAGSPLYAEQLAAMLRDRLVLIAGGALGEEAIPASIAALLAARIDALAAEAKAVLLDASVVGKTFWSGAVAALSARKRADVEPHLAELARRELVRPVFPSTMAGEDEYTFWHALLRDVAYGELTRGARLARHRAVATWLTERAGTVLGEEAEIVVAHLDRALELAIATGATDDVPAIEASLVDALLAAADTALRTEVQRAVGHLRQALGLLEARDPRRPEVLGRIGRGLVNLEEYPDAIVMLEEARSLHLTAGRDVAAALLTRPLYAAYVSRGDAELGDRLYVEADEVFRRNGGPALAGYLADAAQHSWAQSSIDDALRLAEEALSLAHDLGLAPPYRALHTRGAVRLQKGDRSGGEADAREAIRAASAAGDIEATLGALDDLSGQLPWYSNADATAVRDERVEFARSHGLPSSGAEMGRLVALFDLGRWDDALQGATSEYERASERGDVYIRLFATWLRVTIELERGGGASDPAALAAEARSFGRVFAMVSLYPLAARLAITRGEQPFAGALLAELSDVLEPGQLDTTFDAVRAAAEAGRPDLARRLRDLAAPIIRRTGLPDAIVNEAEGDQGVARVWYETGVRLSRTRGAILDEAYSLAGLGRCLLALGETEEGVDRLRESRALWDRLRATPRVAEIDALLA
jgi:class 3 adenylate cyclase/tetratricopeptide (TPR) repeat protein